MSESGWLLVAIVAVVASMWFLGWTAARRAPTKKGAGPKPWLQKRSSRRH